MPVLSTQLKGMRLKIDPLMPGNLFWNNVEEEVHNAYNIFIKKDSIFLDIGANVGLHSYYIARHFKNSHTYAFEPSHINANYIREMISINNIKNITVVEKAVADFSGVCYFDESANNHQGHITESNSGVTVYTTSLDDFLNLHEIHPDIIKIDVEGGEASVLYGFEKKIAALYPTIIVEVHNSGQAKQVADFFRTLDYTLCKLMDIKKTSNSKPFLLIKNDSTGVGPPVHMDGKIVAIPNKNLHTVDSLLCSI